MSEMSIVVLSLSSTPSSPARFQDSFGVVFPMAFFPHKEISLDDIHDTVSSSIPAVGAFEECRFFAKVLANLDPQKIAGRLEEATRSVAIPTQPHTGQAGDG